MKKIIPLVIALLPGIVFAADTIKGTLDLIKTDILSPIRIFLVAVALVAFIWGIVGYIRSAGEEDTSEAKRFIVYGLIGLFIITSVWALVGVIANTLNVPGKGIPEKVGQFK